MGCGPGLKRLIPALEPRRLARSSRLVRPALSEGGGCSSLRRRGVPMTQPLIGLTLDSDEGQGISRSARYGLRANYADAIAEAGGMPVGLPHALDAIDSYADRLDALVVTGGAFDVDPAMFGADAKHATVTLKPN